MNTLISEREKVTTQRKQRLKGFPASGCSFLEQTKSKIDIIVYIATATHQTIRSFYACL